MLDPGDAAAPVPPHARVWSSADDRVWRWWALSVCGSLLFAWLTTTAGCGGGWFGGGCRLSTVQTTVETGVAVLVAHSVAAGAFVVSGLIGCVHTCTRPMGKTFTTLRAVGGVFSLVNFCAGVGYCGHIAMSAGFLRFTSSWLPPQPLSCVDGRPFGFFRTMGLWPVTSAAQSYFAMVCHTPLTPSMISARQRAFRKLLAANWCTMVFGAMVMPTCHAGLRTALLASSIISQVYAMNVNFRLVSTGASRPLRAMALLHPVMLQGFVVPFVARLAGLISVETAEVITTLSDVGHKVVFMSLLMVTKQLQVDERELLHFNRRQEELQHNLQHVQAANLELSQSKAEAERVSQLHTSFVANITHELRTPLNSVIAFNSLLLEDDSLKPEQTEYVRAAITSADALLGVIGQILEYAKLSKSSSAGGGEPDPVVSEPFELMDICNEVVDIVGQQASAHHVEFIVDIDPHLGSKTLLGDHFRLRQAIINVTNNAIKFTPERGEVVLRVTTARPLHLVAQGEPLDVVFVVRDTGIGVPADKMALIFRPFGQVSNTSTRAYGGTGLGLVITKHIMESRLGGSIACQSEVGVGTTMTMRAVFPVQDGHEAPAGPLDQRFVVLVTLGNLSLQEAVARHVMGLGGRCVVLPPPVGATERDQVLHLAHMINAHTEDGSFVVVVMDVPRLVRLEQVGWRVNTNSPCPPKALVMGTVHERREVSEVSPGLLDNSATSFMAKPVKPLQLQRALQRATALSGVPEPGGGGSSGGTGQGSGGVLRGELKDMTSMVREPGVSPDSPADSPSWRWEHGGRVLLVEDNLMNQKVGQAVLQKLALAVDVAGNGEEAVHALLAGNRYDAVLMDVQMPVLDGPAATAQIRQLEAAGRLPGRAFIVAVTAGTASENKEACEQAGVDYFTTKPLYPAKLREVFHVMGELQAQSRPVRRERRGDVMLEPAPQGPAVSTRLRSRRQHISEKPRTRSFTRANFRNS